MLTVTTDILVLGAGLAGLRAAWAAADSSKELSVLVVNNRPGPSGSSFANSNDALGIQVPRTDAARSRFVKDVMSLARPGHVDASLVSILAEESEARFQELLELKLHFRQQSEELARFPGCGSDEPSAYVFENLRHAFAVFERKAASCGVTFNADVEVQGLLIDDGWCLGAWGKSASGRRILIRARSVIMALGGPAPLFEHRVCGPANSGIGPALLREAGCETDNEGWLQFLWHTKDKQYVCPSRLAVPGNRALLPEGENRSCFDPDLLAKRATHCPVFYGHEDARIDRWLVDHMHHDGFVRIRTAEGVIKAAPMAHAGNGGAVVDEHGRTSVRNLFAVGECATGMHGANRLGGAMVLATQVFGRRAGSAAAATATHTDLCMRDWDISSVRSSGYADMGMEEVRSLMRKAMAPFATSLLPVVTNRLSVLGQMYTGRVGLMARAAEVTAAAAMQTLP